jgi:hypothetical protein
MLGNMDAGIERPPEPAPSPHPRRLVVATIAVLPATIFLAAHVLEYVLGIGSAVWLDRYFEFPVLGRPLVALVLVGPVVALALAASWLLPVRLIRDGDAWEIRLRVRVDVWALGIALLAAIVGGFLIGHVAIENLACVIGVPSAC